MENRRFYNEILTEHNIHPDFKHDLPDADIELEGVNHAFILSRYQSTDELINEYMGMIDEYIAKNL